MKSNIENEQRNGIQLLMDIFRESPERRRESLYYLTLANFKVKQYDEAKEYIELLLQMEPSNSQAHDLKKCINERVLKDGYIGLSIVGGAVLTISFLGTIIIRKLNKS